LTVHERGHRSEIDVFPGRQLDNPYSANVIDICPVGALTDRDFRFQCRVWFLGRTKSICPGCSRGCNIEVHFNERYNPRYHERRVQRLKPRFNPDVNGYWMCDEGRYAYHAIDAATRLREPMVREGTSLRGAAWDEAIGKSATALRQALQANGPQAIAVLASPQMTNEELFHLRLLFRDSLGIDNIEYRVPLLEPVSCDGFLITADKNPNSRGAEALGLSGVGSELVLQACADGRIRCLFVFHHDLARGYEVSLVRNALAKVDCIVFQGSWQQSTSELAHVVLPAAVYAEKTGTFTNVEGRVQRIHAAVPPLGESLPDLEILARLAAALDKPLPASHPAEVFRAIGGRVPAFSGMSYDTLGDSGQLLKQD
jgi:NADH-quinone oxidoreductase subunit G